MIMKRSNNVHMSSLIALLLLALQVFKLVKCQLPDDIQSELDASLREQARIQAMRDQQQKLIRNRADHGSTNQHHRSQKLMNSQQQQKPFDPNNYSFQQVSPPVQYSYYQPFGDAANTGSSQQNQQDGTSASQSQKPNAKMDFNIDTLNFELPKPEARVAGESSQRPVSPQFTGVGGLPVGNAPLPPQAQQAGPPLSEADFKDITGGENYGAPAGDDFGLSNAMGSGSGRTQPASSRSSSVGDFPGGDFNPFQENNTPRQQTNYRSGNSDPGMSMPDFGSFGLGASNQNRRGGRRQQSIGDGGNDFGNFDQSMGGNGGNEGFDSFSSQPSGDRASTSSASSDGGSGAPASLQTLLGSGFPGLTGGSGSWDPMASGGNSRKSAADNLDQVTGVNGGGGDDVGSMDIADLGEKSDQFSGANLGTFEQPGPQNDQDFGLGAAASDQQPKSVPYPDGNPQFVGTLWALSQPQSMTQTRYASQIDKGTYQEYPSYSIGGNDSDRVSQVVDSTPKARAPAPGRYGTPSARALAPEVKSGLRSGQHYDYSQAPSIKAAALSSLV